MNLYDEIYLFYKYSILNNGIIDNNKSKIIEWINNNLSEIILNKVVDNKQIKQCATLSSYIAKKASKSDLLAGVIGFSGHFKTCFPIFHESFEDFKSSKEMKCIIVDATYLQFEFSYGSLRDFPKEECENSNSEYIKMINLFEELKKNPMKAAQIYIESHIIPDELYEMFLPINLDSSKINLGDLKSKINIIDPRFDY